MRRLLLVLLMMMLPFQSVWSAAAAVCTHEKAGAHAHFGHHDAHHDPQHDDGADAVDGSLPAGGEDHHHALGVHPLPAVATLPVPLAQDRRERPHHVDAYPTALVAAPEKPPKHLAEAALRRGPTARV